MLKQFRIQDIATLDDERIALTINKALRTATSDCSNRPGVNKSRKVTIVLEINPVLDEDGMCRETDIDVVSHCALPKSRSKTINMGVRSNGQLVFNDASQDDVNQPTLDEAKDGQQEPNLEE